MGSGETILEAAVNRAWPELSRAELAAQVLTLLNQVGDLEIRRAEMAKGMAAMSARCFWRAAGRCEAGCPGRAWCEVEGLKGFAMEAEIRSVGEDACPTGTPGPQ